MAFIASLALRPPVRSATPHGAQDAYASLLKMSFHCRTLTLSPNHMWVSSWFSSVGAKSGSRIAFAT